MNRNAAWAAAFACVLALGCGGGGPREPAGTVAPVPRRAVLWLDSSGVDALTASRLRTVGVDELVVQRGLVGLGGDVPVLRLTPAPPVAGSIPTAMALEVSELGPDPDPGMAAAMWKAIAAEVGDAIPAELILAFPQLAPGVDDLVRRLATEAGVPVVPLLRASQLGTEEAVRLVAAARSCIVPAFGTGYGGAQWADEESAEPLAERLAPLADAGARVRIAVSLRPITAPRLEGWGEGLNPLTEPENATISTSSELDRTFVLKRALAWGGRGWQAGDSVAVRWIDAARLNSALVEVNRLVLPEVGGWDLVSLPPVDGGLGMDREALIRYLGGAGPTPEVDVRAERSRDQVRLFMANPGPFASAVSGVGNWVEVSVAEGSLAAERPGTFDRLVLGTVDGDEWSPSYEGAARGVRFFESFVGPGEEMESGPVRLSSRRASCRVRWHLTLTSGEVLQGETVSRP